MALSDVLVHATSYQTVTVSSLQIVSYTVAATVLNQIVITQSEKTSHSWCWRMFMSLLSGLLDCPV